MKRCLADDGYWKRKPCNDECIYYDTCIYRGNKDRERELKAQEQELKERNAHDNGELAIMQSYPLERKIQLTCERMKAWDEWWDGNIAYSFSGGIDSTVMVDIGRNRCGINAPAVFVDTGLEYPEIREFVKTYKYNIPICSVYGDVVEDLSGTDEVQGQLTFSDLEGFEGYTDYDATRPKLKTTGCDRTGCMFCGYGCHLEKEGEGRFERMKETHPKQYEYIMKPIDKGGLGYKEVIDWINENNEGNIHIRY